MEVKQYLEKAVSDGASDLFIVAGGRVSEKLDGHIRPLTEGRVLPDVTQQLIQEIYCLANRDMNRFLETGDDDFSFALAGLARFRVNTYRQRGSMASVIRVVSFDVPDYKTLGIPESILNMTEETHGLLIVSGIAGSGKSTTQACLIDRINRTREAHIITLEDPIEYLHRDQKSIISQREVTIDTVDYLSALRASLRQAPDVILLGEMRDHETIRTAMTAAETGHLVIATLHTKGAVNTIDRIIDAFPSRQQSQVRTQLAMVLRAVASQQLLPKTDGGMAPAFELMTMNSAVRSMIRDCKTYQIENEMRTAETEKLFAMDQSILNLFRAGKITRETALDYADNPNQLQRRMDA